MVGLRYKNIRDIHQVIAPQNILIDDRSIYIFDKINIDEGRLYRFNQDFSDKQLIIEVDDGECFFGRDGYVYILYADSDSIIEVYDLNGSKKKDIRLVGTAYSMDVDEMGNIFAIFMDEGGMSIRMFNNNGEFIRTLHSRNLSLLSSVYCKDQYVYIAGFSMDTPLRIEKINFMSYIMNIYDLGLKSSEYIISRMIQYNDTLIAILSGDNKDIIILVNEKSGEKYEVDTALYGIQNINDIFIQKTGCLYWEMPIKLQNMKLF